MPETAFGSEVVVTVGGVGLIAMVYVCVTTLGLVATSVTEMLKVKVPAVVGVPVSAPVVEEMLIPVGNEPVATAQCSAPVPPEAATEAE